MKRMGRENTSGRHSASTGSRYGSCLATSCNRSRNRSCSAMSRNFVFCKLTLCLVDSVDLRTCAEARNRLLEEVDPSLRRLGILFSLIEQLFRHFQIFQLRVQVF